MNVLAAAPKPLGTYDILPAVARPGGGAVYPSQIYRALDRLIDARLVQRVESLAAYLPHGRGATLVLVCTSCGAALQSDGAALHRTLCEAAEREGFAVGRSIVEALGRCADCAGAEA